MCPRLFHLSNLPLSDGPCSIIRYEFGLILSMMESANGFPLSALCHSL